MLEWALLIYQIGTNAPAPNQDNPRRYLDKQECYHHAASLTGWWAKPGPVEVGEPVHIDHNVYGVCQPAQRD